MTDKGVFLTRQGYIKMQEELAYLKGIRRREISAQIEEARLQGDLRENAEYDAAKEAQAKLEERIMELEAKLTQARIIESEEIPQDKVYIGASVKVLDLDTNEDFIYILVSQEEADYAQNKISISSPIGRALLGHSIGEEIKIQIPAGLLRYKILDIQR